MKLKDLYKHPKILAGKPHHKQSKHDPDGRNFLIQSPEGTKLIMGVCSASARSHCPWDDWEVVKECPSANDQKKYGFSSEIVFKPKKCNDTASGWPLGPEHYGDTVIIKKRDGTAELGVIEYVNPHGAVIYLSHDGVLCSIPAGRCRLFHDCFTGSMNPDFNDSVKFDWKA